MEYVHGQLFERTVESGCGAVTCLPGALTMLRFSAFRGMAKQYFSDKAEQCQDLFDYGKCHLGEDRWLTHLFMIGSTKRYQIQMCTSAFCKTEAVQTYASLVKQRRRWFLGFITNEVCMLTDIRIWKRYPILALVRFMQNTIRTTALLFFIMLLAIITTSKKVADLPVGFIAVSLGLNWLMMIYFGFKLKRYKVWLYPLMFVVNPFFNWYYMVYGIFTAGQRTWGGPRADAAVADAHTTPQQAIEMAAAAGDDLNLVPETFHARAAPRKPVPLQPSERVEGRFAVPERHPDGLYHQDNDSQATMDANGILVRPRMPHRNRDSLDSFVSQQSGVASIYMPRRVESFMGEEDQIKYAMAQAGQPAAGGAYMTAHVGLPKHSEGSAVAHKAEWSQSTESLGSEKDRLHTPVAAHTRIVPQNARLSVPAQSTPLPHGAGEALEMVTPSDASATRTGRDGSRNGRSPLARLSLVRTPSGGAASPTPQQAASTSPASQETAGSTETARTRNKLQKRRK